jgi:hypothetical protein
LSGTFLLRKPEVIRFPKWGWGALMHPTTARYMHGARLLVHGVWVHHIVRAGMHQMGSGSVRLIYVVRLTVSALQTVHDRFPFV